MASHIVAYDLHKQGQNYDCIIKKLEAYGTYWHIQGSVWIIKSDQTCAQIRDHLKTCLDDNDKLFVGRLTGEAAWVGYPQNITTWLKDHL